MLSDGVTYFPDMAILIFDAENSWPMSQARSLVRVLYETNQQNIRIIFVS